MLCMVSNLRGIVDMIKKNQTNTKKVIIHLKKKEINACYNSKVSWIKEPDHSVSYGLT